MCKTVLTRILAVMILLVLSPALAWTQEQPPTGFTDRDLLIRLDQRQQQQQLDQAIRGLKDDLLRALDSQQKALEAGQQAIRIQLEHLDKCLKGKCCALDKCGDTPAAQTEQRTTTPAPSSREQGPGGMTTPASPSREQGLRTAEMPLGLSWGWTLLVLIFLIIASIWGTFAMSQRRSGSSLETGLANLTSTLNTHLDEVIQKLNAIEQHLSPLAGLTGTLNTHHSEVIQKLNAIEQHLSPLANLTSTLNTHLDEVIQKLNAIERHIDPTPAPSDPLQEYLKRLSEAVERLAAAASSRL